MSMSSSSSRMKNHAVVHTVSTLQQGTMLQLSQFTDGQCFFSLLNCTIQVLQSYHLRWSLQSSDFNQGLEFVVSTNRHHHVTWLGPPAHRGVCKIKEKK